MFFPFSVKMIVILTIITIDFTLMIIKIINNNIGDDVNAYNWNRDPYQSSQVLVASLLIQHQSKAAVDVNRAGVPAKSF